MLDKTQKIEDWIFAKAICAGLYLYVVLAAVLVMVATTAIVDGSAYSKVQALTEYATQKVSSQLESYQTDGPSQVDQDDSEIGSPDRGSGLTSPSQETATEPATRGLKLTSRMIGTIQKPVLIGSAMASPMPGAVPAFRIQTPEIAEADMETRVQQNQVHNLGALIDQWNQARNRGDMQSMYSMTSEQTQQNCTIEEFAGQVNMQTGWTPKSVSYNIERETGTVNLTRKGEGPFSLRIQERQEETWNFIEGEGWGPEVQCHLSKPFHFGYRN